MKIKFSVNSVKYERRHTTEMDLPGYYGIEDVIKDLAKVLEYHQFKHAKMKQDYISEYGQKYWDQYILGVENEESS